MSCTKDVIKFIELLIFLAHQQRFWQLNLWLIHEYLKTVELQKKFQRIRIFKSKKELLSKVYYLVSILLNIIVSLEPKKGGTPDKSI